MFFYYLNILLELILEIKISKSLEFIFSQTTNKQQNAPEFDKKYRQKYEDEKHQNDLLHLKLAQAAKEIEGFKSGGLLDTSQLKHLLEEVKTDSNSSQEQELKNIKYSDTKPIFKI